PHAARKQVGDSSACSGSSPVAADNAPGSGGAGPVLMGRRSACAANFENCGFSRHDSARRPSHAAAGRGGASEAANFAFRVGPVVRATSDASEEQKEEVRAAL